LVAISVALKEETEPQQPEEVQGFPAR